MSSPQSLPEPQNLTHLHPPPSLAPLGACSAPLAASEPPSGLRPAGNSTSAAAHIPSSFLPPGILASLTPRRQPRFLFSREKHPQGAPQPDPPAPGDALCRSSAARTPSGKQPQGPGKRIGKGMSPSGGELQLLPCPPLLPKLAATILVESFHHNLPCNHSCFHSSCKGQTAQGFPAAFPKSGIAQAGPHHFGVECPDGRAGCQQLCNLPFLLLQVELREPGLEQLSRACLGQAQG